MQKQRIPDSDRMKAQNTMQGAPEEGDEAVNSAEEFQGNDEGFRGD